MLYLAHAHQATATLQSLLLPSFFPGRPCLAVVKHTSIAFLSVSASNEARESASTNASTDPSSGLLEELVSVELNARILSVEAVAIDLRSAQPSQALLVLTDHYEPRLIALAGSRDQQGQPQVLTKSTLPLHEGARSPAESSLRLWTEPLSDVYQNVGQRIAACHVYKGLMRIVPLKSAAPAPAASTDTDAVMEDISSGQKPAAQNVNFTQSFGVRLPHPNLISCAPLAPRSVDDRPALALLSVSSVPSRIPGFGEQCLPVLSFQSVNLQAQDLSPLAWGPPRKPPRSDAAASGSALSSTDPAEDSGTTSRQGPSKTGDKGGAKKKHGPSAMGMKLDEATLQKREEAWAKSDLARSHVPLPHADALGAHHLHALPANIGGGVLVFSENSILYVPAPGAVKVLSGASEQAEASSSSKGKRRKSSTSGPTDSRRLSSSNTAEASATKPGNVGSASNENGKRRRSSAAASAASPPSPTQTRGDNNSLRRVRLLRASLPFPVQVVASVDVADKADLSSSVVRSGSGASIFSVLFGCHSGHLNVVRIGLSEEVDESGLTALRPRNLQVQSFGEISQPAGPQGLCYMGEGLVHVSSATGDTVIYRIQPAEESKDAETLPEAQLVTPPASPSQTRRARSFSFGLASGPKELPSAGNLTQLRRWDNLAPIVDFVVDDGSNGDPTAASGAQARIITCSGSGPSGSIRIVRTGVSTQEHSSISIPQVRRIWPVHRGKGETKITTAVVLGLALETVYLAFGPDGALQDQTSLLEAIGFTSSLAAITVSSIKSEGNGADFVIVNKDKVILARQAAGALTLLDQWSPQDGSEISAASSNEEGQIVLSSSSRSLSYLQVEGGRLGVHSTMPLQQQVSCLDISMLHPGRVAEYIACGFWQTCSIQIYALPDLKPVAQQSVSQGSYASVPRSILLHRFRASTTSSSHAKSSDKDASHPHLLIGLGDGTLVSYSLSLPTADSYSPTVGMTDCKMVSFGTSALRLEAIETAENAWAVAVSGGRPTIVFADAKRFSYNPISFEGVESVATLFAGHGHSVNLFALEKSLRLASVGALQKRDIQTIPLGLEQPLAVSLWDSHRILAVCTWSFLPRGSATEQKKSRGAVQILDQSRLNPIFETRLEAHERPNCIKVIKIREREILLVGTGYILPDSAETTSGRLIGFEFRRKSGEDAGELRTLFQYQVKGNVYSIQGIHDRIVAAVNSEVKVLHVMERVNAPSSGKEAYTLKQVGSWACSFIACNLSVVEPNRIIVGDALRSMSVLEIDRESAYITEVARDCDPFWTTATEMVDEDTQTFIGADISFNIYTTQRVKMSDEVKKRIRRAKDQEMESGRRRLPTSNAVPDADEGYAHIMQREAVWHYGDMINKFVRGSLAPEAGANKIAISKLLFCTAAGAIGVIAQVQGEAAQVIGKVERNIIGLIESTDEEDGSGDAKSTGYVGAIRHQDWRTLRTDHRVQAPAGFVDGEVVQMFVNGRLDRQQRERVLRGPRSAAEAIDTERETVERYIEALSQLC